MIRYHCIPLRKPFLLGIGCGINYTLQTYEKSKSLVSVESIITRLKLKEID